jgi:hypothetical protein
VAFFLDGEITSWIRRLSSATTFFVLIFTALRAIPEVASVGTRALERTFPLGVPAFLGSRGGRIQIVRASAEGRFEN